MTVYRGFATDNNGTRQITDVECVLEDIKNNIMTEKGSRVMRPNFGSIIPHILLDVGVEGTENLIRSDIQRIVHMDPRANIVGEITVEYDRETGEVKISIPLEIIGMSEITWLNISFNEVGTR